MAEKIGIVLFMRTVLAKAFLEMPDYGLLAEDQIRAVPYSYWDRVWGELDYFSDNIKAAMQAVDQGGGIVILTDEGGLPKRVAEKVAAEWPAGKVAVIPGTNLDVMNSLMKIHIFSEDDPGRRFVRKVEMAVADGHRGIGIAPKIFLPPETSDVRAAIGGRGSENKGDAPVPPLS